MAGTQNTKNRSIRGDASNEGSNFSGWTGDADQRRKPPQTKANDFHWGTADFMAYHEILFAFWLS